MPMFEQIPERIPAHIAALCLTIYWAYVIRKLIRMRRKHGTDPNAMPKELIGQLMRILWYPIIMILIAALWITAVIAPNYLKTHTNFLLQWLFPPTTWWYIAVFPASLICIIFTIFTFVCWRKMGRSWRIGINPNEKLTLVSTGPYRYVRHPIYSLRMVINACAFLMAPTLLVLIPAAIDFLLLQIEARREERYMESTHGQDYANYKKSVGRFVPRAFVV